MGNASLNGRMLGFLVFDYPFLCFIGWLIGL